MHDYTPLLTLLVGSGSFKPSEVITTLSFETTLPPSLLLASLLLSAGSSEESFNGSGLSLLSRTPVCPDIRELQICQLINRHYFNTQGAMCPNPTVVSNKISQRNVYKVDATVSNLCMSMPMCWSLYCRSSLCASSYLSSHGIHHVPQCTLLLQKGICYSWFCESNSAL